MAINNEQGKAAAGELPNRAIRRGGFRNEYNTCFLGATIQCLLADPALEKMIEAHDCTYCKRTCAAGALKICAKTTEQGTHGSVDHWKPILRAWNMKWGEQHAAHEFFMNCTGDLPEEMVSNLRVRRDTFIRTSYRCACRGPQRENVIREMDTHVLLDLTGEQGYRFPSISTALAARDNWVTLSDLSRSCPICQERASTERCVHERPTGKLLALAVSRERPLDEKCRDLFTVSESILFDGVRWNLQAVVIHRGEKSNVGHYVTYTRMNDTIACFDDAKYSACITWPAEVHTDGVLFFYSKIACRNDEAGKVED